MNDNDHDDDGPVVRWNPDGAALDGDGEPVLGRWEYWADGDLALWWSEDDRQTFHREQDGES